VNLREAGFANTQKTNVFHLLAVKIQVYLQLQHWVIRGVSSKIDDGAVESQVIAENFRFSNFWINPSKSTQFVKNLAKQYYPISAVCADASARQKSGAAVPPSQMEDLFKAHCKNSKKGRYAGKYMAMNKFLHPLSQEEILVIMSKSGGLEGLSDDQRNMVELHHYKIPSHEVVDVNVSKTTNRDFHKSIESIVDQGVFTTRFLRRMVMAYAGFWNIYHPYLKEVAVQKLVDADERDLQHLKHCRAKVLHFMKLVRPDQGNINLLVKDDLVDDQATISYLSQNEANIESEIQPFLDIRIMS